MFLKPVYKLPLSNMSPPPKGSKHRGNQSRGTDENYEDIIAQVKSVVTQLDGVLSSSPHEWATYTPSARSAIEAIDRIHFFRDPRRLAEQVWVLQGLQDFAYHDPDSGCIRDIAEWCQTAWLRILRDHPENVEALAGRPSSPRWKFTECNLRLLTNIQLLLSWKP